MNDLEDQMVYKLSSIIEENDPNSAIIVGDMGFTDTNLMRFLRDDLGYGFAIRIRSNVYINEDGINAAPVWSYAPSDGSNIHIKNTFITHSLSKVESIIVS